VDSFKTLSVFYGNVKEKSGQGSGVSGQQYDCKRTIFLKNKIALHLRHTADH
jgi:hypothetical protein